MSINFKRGSGLAHNFFIFGKLPRRSDFVRVNASTAEAMHLDGLIAASLKQLKMDDGGVARYRAMPATTFIARFQGGLFMGALQPSYDEAGRNYPLVAGTYMGELEARPVLAHLILAKELFFSGLKEQLSNAIGNSVEMLACRDFLQEQVLFDASLNADMDLAKQLLDHHLRQTTVGEIGCLLLGRGRERLDQVLLGFLFQQQLLKKFASSLPAQMYLLPLPDLDGEDVLYAAMWLVLYQAATSKNPLRSEQFFMLTSMPGRYLALIPEGLNDRHFRPCWGEIAESGVVIDVNEESAPWRTDKAYAEATYVLGRRLSDPAMSVAELCDVIRNVALSVG